jgi:hypothetical protein
MLLLGNPSSNPLHRPLKSDFDTENAYRKPPVVPLNIPEAACDKLILAHFPSANERSVTREHRQITKKGILRWVSVTVSILVSNFKEANKKLLIVQGSEKHISNSVWNSLVQLFSLHTIFNEGQYVRI